MKLIICYMLLGLVLTGCGRPDAPPKSPAVVPTPPIFSDYSVQGNYVIHKQWNGGWSGYYSFDVQETETSSVLFSFRDLTSAKTCADLLTRDPNQSCL